jgi:aldehyde:ferredoxin oxidoreductase
MTRSLYGCGGSILRVDLTATKFFKEPIEKYIPKFLGGRGTNQWILFKELR